MRPLAARERRLVALGLLVAVIAAVWLGLVSPVLNGFQARAQKRQELIAAYQRNQRLSAAIPTLRAQAAEQRRTEPLYQLAMAASASPAETLKQRVSDALTGAGGTMSALQTAPSTVAPGWVSVRADTQINLTQLDSSIRRMEDQPPYVVVEYVLVGADRALQTGRAAPLDVRVQVSALAPVVAAASR